MDEEGIPPTALREISLFQMLSTFIYIVRLICVLHIHHNDKPPLYLVFKYLDTDLNKFLDSHRKGPNPSPIPSSQIQRLLFQLCKGVAHCHGHDVLHIDLKPQNLLVDKEKEILKIVDLVLGRVFTVPIKSYTHEIVTHWYRAPEVLLGSTHYSTGVDMWFVGCILGVSSLRDGHVHPRWEPHNLACVVPSLGPDGVDLLSKMLKYDPSDRILAKTTMDHPYFDSLDKSQF